MARGLLYLAKRSFTKHMLRLRHESLAAPGVGDSHDGTSSYQLMAGMFRLVCSNGIVGAGNGFDELRVKHTGDVKGLVLDGCIEILARLPEVSEQVREWSGLQLTQGERGAYAAAALALRYDEQEQAPVTAAALLNVRRAEDAAPSLWNTLNTVQEHVIAGGDRYVLRDAAGRRKQARRTGEVAGIGENVRLNRGLWVLAAEMAKLKTV